mgnify:CR=1 FL=1
MLVIFWLSGGYFSTAALRSANAASAVLLAGVMLGREDFGFGFGLGFGLGVAFALALGLGFGFGLAVLDAVELIELERGSVGWGAAATWGSGGWGGEEGEARADVDRVTDGREGHRGDHLVEHVECGVGGVDNRPRGGVGGLHSDSRGEDDDVQEA